MNTRRLSYDFKIENIRLNKIIFVLCCILLTSLTGCASRQARELEVLRQIDKVIEWRLRTPQENSVLVILYLDTEEIEDSTKTAEYRCYSRRCGSSCGYSGIKNLPFGTPWSTWEKIRPNDLKKEIVIDPGPPYKNFTKVVNLIPGEVTNLGRIVLEKVDAEGTASISGTIKDENGAPLEAVEVSCEKGVAVTDSQGRYNIDGFELDIYNLRAEKNGYIPVKKKVSIRDMDNRLIEENFVLSLPRKVRLRYVITPKDKDDFNDPATSTGTVEFLVDKTYMDFPTDEVESNDFRSFINRTRMGVRLNNSKLNLSASHAPVFFERLRSAYVGFEAIKGVGNLDYNMQFCPTLEEGNILLIDGGKISDYTVKILFEEIQPVLP